MIRASSVRFPVLQWIAAMATVEALAGCSLDVGYLDEGPTDARVPDATSNADGPGTSDESAVDVPDAASDATAIPDQNAPDHPVADSAPANEAGTVDAAADAADAAVDSAPSCDMGSPAGNIIQNWSFECGLSPWYAWSGVVNTTTSTFHSGATSVVASGRTQSYLGPVQDLTSVLVAGHIYSGSAFATVGATGDDGGAVTGSQMVNMTLKFICADGDGGANYEQVGSVAGVRPGTWTPVSGTLSVPAGCTPAGGTRFELYLEGPEVGVDLYVDDVVVKY